MSKVKNGNNVRVHYKGTLEDGTVFDNSYDREQTLDFEVGSGNIIPGFDKAVVGMAEGETKTFKVPCSEAYKEHNPEAIFKVPKSAFDESVTLVEGQAVQGTSTDGRPIQATIHSFDEENVTLDHNHPLAGKDLNFEVELVEIL
jgi:peptidylprolyl isomerase